MDVLLSLLLFTGVIFVIMRLATAHKAQGVDPVCGMKVAAHQGFLSAHGGVEYRFCSLSCLENFERGLPAYSQRAA
jgi:YHS domain-containing protein